MYSCSSISIASLNFASATIASILREEMNKIDEINKVRFFMISTSIQEVYHNQPRSTKNQYVIFC